MFPVVVPMHHAEEIEVQALAVLALEDVQME
jgi:hypothetical protein